MRYIQSITADTLPEADLKKRILKTPDDQDTRRMYQWEFSGTLRVSNIWVTDGYELTNERLQEMLEDAIARDLDCAGGGEYNISSTVTSSPPQELIRLEQGYPEEENGNV